MSKFTNLKKLKGVKWITVENGQKVPIENGESKEQAIKKHFDDKAKSVHKPLTEQIDDVLNGDYKDSHVTILEETPKIFQDVGVPNKPMLMTTKHIYLAINESGKYKGENDHYHNLGKQKFLDVTLLLKSPIFAFQSDRNENDIIAIVSAVDKLGNPIIVPMQLNGSGKYNFVTIDANIAKSMYGKRNIQNFIDKYVTKDNILFLHNKKIRNIRN